MSLGLGDITRLGCYSIIASILLNTSPPAMSSESPTDSVGSQDPMEPPQNTETDTAQIPLPAAEPADTIPPSEVEPEAGPPKEEAAPEEEAASENFDALAADLQLSLD
eukprot:818481-Rhodomonas_salina.1